jgi:hypothetical protein
MELSESFRVQADACRALGSPMYGELLDVLADDYDAAGPTRDLLAGHEGDAGPSALGLRLMGSVHRLVLEGRAEELALFYPSVGGTYIPAAADAALLRLVAEHPDAIRRTSGRTSTPGSSGCVQRFRWLTRRRCVLTG